MIVASLLAALTMQGGSRVPGTGQLQFFPANAKAPTLCALTKTQVDANVDGFGARVTVVQTFRNPSRTPVEAIYTFPLPNDSAVDRMRIQVGSRIIEGELKRRDDARVVYEAAKNAGQTASLLDQERANIFTQSIANLMPGQEVKVEISYAQMLKYEGGQYEFSFPMTIGPRYMGATTPDPGKISPSFAPTGTRTGADIDLKVHLNAGAAIKSLTSVLHKIRSTRPDEQHAEVELGKANEIPNRDFILKYSVATDKVQSAFLTNYDPIKGGFFSLVLMPPKAPTNDQIAPKELIFVMDQSGSQSGFPIEKSKELTLKMIEKMRPGDTFNVLGFSNDVNKLWASPRRNTADNRSEASAWVRKMEVTGGTELQKAVIAALSPAPDPRRLRYVVFNTDGFVGQDKQIIDDLRQYRGTSRLFAFGIGNSVNRDLIDAMSVEGRGDSEIVTLAEDANGAVDRFLKRSGNPILSSVSVSCDDATELSPAVLPDVLSDKPIIVYGRYSKPGPGKIIVSGKIGGQPWSRTIDVNFPVRNQDDSAITSLWARHKIDDISRAGFIREVSGDRVSTVKDQVEKVALAYNIMSAYTSFVAVEKRVVNVGGRTRTVNVPLEAPDGVDMSMAMDGRVNSLSSNVRYRRSGNTTLGLRVAPMGGAGGGFGGASGALGGFAGRAQVGQTAAPATTPALAAAKTKAGLSDLSSASDAIVAPDELKIAPALKRVKSGVVAIQIGLANLKPETLAKLKKLGFVWELSLDDLKVVVGKIDVTKLKAIAALTEVKTIGLDK